MLDRESYDLSVLDVAENLAPRKLVTGLGGIAGSIRHFVQIIFTPFPPQHTPAFILGTFYWLFSADG